MLHLISGGRVALNVGTNEEQIIDLAHDYDHDFVAWLEEQAAAASNGRTDALDLPHIAEELRSMGASDRRALASHLRNLMLHVLKWVYQPTNRSRSWRSSINNARTEIAALLDDSPSLANRANLESVIAREYTRARRQAAGEMGIDESELPQVCPFALDQVFDEDFPWDEEVAGPLRGRNG